LPDGRGSDLRALTGTTCSETCAQSSRMLSTARIDENVSMITIRLDLADEARLGKLAAERGETPEETARSVLLAHLSDFDWPEDRDEDWARSSASMAARFLPREDWAPHAPGTTDEPG
ncbi:MAG: hypothetical protein WBC44_08060, partial [Planctomycetaceae bacterium]